MRARNFAARIREVIKGRSSACADDKPAKKYYIKRLSHRLARMKVPLVEGSIRDAWATVSAMDISNEDDVPQSILLFFASALGVAAAGSEKRLTRERHAAIKKWASDSSTGLLYR